MHRKQHRPDIERTRQLFLSHVFKSSYSYLSFRIHPLTEHQCEYLAGKDCEARRSEVFIRDRHRCVDCGNLVTWEDGHLAHKGNTKVSRCWCPENLDTKCYNCHMVREHKRFPQWRKRNVDEFTAT